MGFKEALQSRSLQACKDVFNKVQVAWLLAKSDYLASTITTSSALQRHLVNRWHRQLPETFSPPETNFSESQCCVDATQGCILLLLDFRPDRPAAERGEPVAFLPLTNHWFKHEPSWNPSLDYEVVDHRLRATPSLVRRHLGYWWVALKELFDYLKSFTPAP